MTDVERPPAYRQQPYVVVSVPSKVVEFDRRRRPIVDAERLQERLNEVGGEYEIVAGSAEDGGALVLRRRDVER